MKRYLFYKILVKLFKLHANETMKTNFIDVNNGIDKHMQQVVAVLLQFC